MSTADLERLAAEWLDARAGGDLRAWRDASTKLDAALADAALVAKIAATLQPEPSTERNP